MGSVGIRGAWAQCRAALRGGGGANGADRGFCAVSCDKRHCLGSYHGLGGAAALVLAAKKIQDRKIKVSRWWGFFVGQAVDKAGGEW